LNIFILNVSFIDDVFLVLLFQIEPGALHMLDK
jgi:hypothetical protein